MATTFVIACPECEKQVKVSEEHIGKKVRCKGCENVFTVKAPGASAASPEPKAKGKAPPPPPPGKKGAPAPPPPPAPGNPIDDDEDNPNPYALTKEKDSLPRCPFCAKELPSETAVICLHCGYNTRTRTRPEVKQIYQPTGGEVFLWLLPGILCILTMIGFIVWYILFWGLIESWLKGSALEESDGTYIGGLSPGMFRLYMSLLLVALSVPLVRFSYKRLVVNNKPPERKIKGD